MSSPNVNTLNTGASSPSSDNGRNQMPNSLSQKPGSLPGLPTSEGLRAPAGGLLRGATDENGKLTKAALLVGIKLDLEAEVHLTARVRGDIVIGLY